MGKKATSTSGKKMSAKSETGKKAAMPSEQRKTSKASVSSSIEMELPYLITTFKDGLNYRVALDVHLLSGISPKDVAVSIQNGDVVVIECTLPDTMFSTGRVHKTGAELGEDRISRFEEEVLSLRQRFNATQERRFRSTFKIKLAQKIEDRFYKSRHTKAIQVNLYDLDVVNFGFQKATGQTVSILHVNMTAVEKLIDYDDNDDVEFKLFTTSFASTSVDSASKKRKSTDHSTPSTPVQNDTAAMVEH